MPAPGAGSLIDIDGAGTVDPTIPFELGELVPGVRWRRYPPPTPINAAMISAHASVR
jgi:hypothetical protein